MSLLDTSELSRIKMSPLDDMKSPNDSESELMRSDMLDDHQSGIDGLQKRKRDIDNDELESRKLPSLTNNNDVTFVLESNAEDHLHEDAEDVSCFPSMRNTYFCIFYILRYQIYRSNNFFWAKEQKVFIILAIC